MRNHFFLLAVLAVTLWTSRGDPTGDGDNDIYLEGMDGIDGSGDYSSYSSYDYQRSSDDEGSDDIDEDELSGVDPLPTVPMLGSVHLNKLFIDAYKDPESLEYNQLATNFVLAMDELMYASPLADNYIATRVIKLSPGSVQVDFEVELQPLNHMGESLESVIEAGVNAGNFAGLNPNVSTLVIKPQADPDITFTTASSHGDTSPTMIDNGTGKYRPTKPGVKDGDEVDREEENILDMILGDPIIIAAIVGGLVVILLSVILLFLFVVYRLKKKDEGSYSLDEPAKSKDPTAYWKETKEFYA